MDSFDRRNWLTREIFIRPGQTAVELGDKCGRDNRTIQRDVRILREKGYAIVNDSGYRFYERPHLPPIVFEDREVIALQLACTLAQSHVDSELREVIGTVFDKIKQTLTESKLRSSQALEKRIAVPGGSNGDTVFLKLTQAIEAQRLARFSYRGFKDDSPRDRVVEPLGLIFQDGRWYLDAFDRESLEKRTLRLERIQNLEISAERFPSRGFIPEEAGFHAWDIDGEEPTVVVLEVMPQLARWLVENPPHPSLEVKQPRASLKVRAPENLIPWLLSLRGAKLLSPVWLKEKVLSRLRELELDFQ